MKGEYVEAENDNNNQNTSIHNTPNMFAKFPHHHYNHPKFQPPPHHQHPHNFPPPHHPPFLQESSNHPTTPPPPHNHPQHHPSSKKSKTTPPTSTQPSLSNEDSGTIELPRRPRGRPPGSKNKPKSPIIITHQHEPPMSSYILELPNGLDIIESLTRLTRHRGVGLCILSATGAVANVRLKQPSTSTSSTPCGTVTFHGRFDILSLSGVVVNTVAMHGGGGGGFTISLAGPQGQIIGGKVGGALVCSGTVYVIAASFNNPTYCKLPLLDDEQDEQAQQQPPPPSLPPPPQSHHKNQCDDNQENSSAGLTDEVIWGTSSSARPTY